MAARVWAQSFAKINLYLEVVRKREDGYHDIETIFQTVGLHDNLQFERTAAAISLHCSNTDLPLDDNNLVVRAAKLLQSQSGHTQGAAVFLEKNIPIAAGLAGGSGNAAATLAALNLLWDLDWPTERLSALALELGSDVPFCLEGGRAAGRGRGELLTPLPALEDVWLLLLCPALEVRAAEAYTHPMLRQELNGRVSRANFDTVVRKVQDRDWYQVVFNRLERPVFERHSFLADLKMRLLDAGCLAAAMSGSGPSLFGICRDKAHAESVRAAFPDCRCSTVKTVSCGVRIATAPWGDSEDSVEASMGERET